MMGFEKFQANLAELKKAVKSYEHILNERNQELVTVNDEKINYLDVANNVVV